MKVLFLDFDGVLGPMYFKPHARHVCHPAHAIHEKCQQEMRRVIETTGCKIVFSTNWRTSHNVSELADYLIEAGIIEDRAICIDTTPELDTGVRGDEIALWLEQHPEVEVFAIVDDIPDAAASGRQTDAGFWEWDPRKELSDRFVETDARHGLTPADADELIELLDAPKRCGS